MVSPATPRWAASLGGGFDTGRDTGGRDGVSSLDTTRVPGLTGLRAGDVWSGLADSGASPDFLKSFEMAPNMCSGRHSKRRAIGEETENFFSRNFYLREIGIMSMGVCVQCERCDLSDVCTAKNSPSG